MSFTVRWNPYWPPVPKPSSIQSDLLSEKLKKQEKEIEELLAKKPSLQHVLNNKSSVEGCSNDFSQETHSSDSSSSW